MEVGMVRWVLLCGVLGCAGEVERSAPGAEDPEPGGGVDPFAERPDVSEGLVNVSHDLDALLEFGALEGACDRYREAPDDRRLKLMCGKSMFFYEGFGTIGIPTVLLDGLGSSLSSLGEAYENLGLIADPYGPVGRPLGFGLGAPLEDVETLAMTCGSCHFGRLPDGRYAVGAPNHDYEYGAHMLALTLAPSAIAPGFDASTHHPDALAKLEPLLTELDENPLFSAQLLLQMLPMASLADEVPQMDWETEGHYAHWSPGTMDFVIAPLPIDDGVHTVSKIAALYGIPTDAEMADAGMPHAMLAWTGAAVSLTEFLDGFVRIGDGGDYTAADLEPLRDYILSLRPPPVDPDNGTGEQVFAEAGCLSCHSGPQGSGTRVYTFEEVETDDALRYWGDPELTGRPCCGLTDDPNVTLTHGVKSPRLVGLWGMGRFLHNGSVESLEELLCVDGPRSVIDEPAYGNQGHAYGCALSLSDKEALLDYLRSH
jgi:hypothetical protein